MSGHAVNQRRWYCKSPSRDNISSVGMRSRPRRIGGGVSVSRRWLSVFPSRSKEAARAEVPPDRPPSRRHSRCSLKAQAPIWVQSCASLGGAKDRRDRSCCTGHSQGKRWQCGLLDFAAAERAAAVRAERAKSADGPRRRAAVHLRPHTVPLSAPPTMATQAACMLPAQSRTKSRGVHSALADALGWFRSSTSG